VGHGSTAGGVSNRFSRHQGEIHWGRVGRPIDGDVGHFIGTEEGCKLEEVIVHHRTGNVLIGNFCQVDCGLYVTGSLRHSRCQDPGPAIDGHQFATISGGDGHSRDIGQCSAASLRALTAPIAPPSRGSPLSIAGLLNSFPCQAATRLNTELSKVSFLFAVGADAGQLVLTCHQESCRILPILHRMGTSD